MLFRPWFDEMILFMCLKISDLLFKVFGVWLSQQELGSDGIPHLVAKCLQFVETYGMSVSMLISSRSGKSRDYRDVIIFECFSSTRKWKAGVFKSSGLNSVFDDLRFRDRLVWTERRLRFQISPAQCGSCLTSHLCFFLIQVVLRWKECIEWMADSWQWRN